jgi:hypothetical protein
MAYIPCLPACLPACRFGYSRWLLVKAPSFSSVSSEKWNVWFFISFFNRAKGFGVVMKVGTWKE